MRSGSYTYWGDTKKGKSIKKRWRPNGGQKKRYCGYIIKRDGTTYWGGCMSERVVHSKFCETHQYLNWRECSFCDVHEKNMVGNCCSSCRCKTCGAPRDFWGGDGDIYDSHCYDCVKRLYVCWLMYTKDVPPSATEVIYNHIFT